MRKVNISQIIFASPISSRLVRFLPTRKRFTYIISCCFRFEQRPRETRNTNVTVKDCEITLTVIKKIGDPLQSNDFHDRNRIKLIIKHRNISTLLSHISKHQTSLYARKFAKIYHVNTNPNLIFEK